MTKNFTTFVNEDAPKWYSNADDIDKERGGSRGQYMEDDYDQSTGTYANHRPGYYDDDDGVYDPDGDDYDDDYGYSGGSSEYFDEDDDYKIPDIRNQYDPKAEYAVGDEIVYAGNTGGRRNQEGKIRRIREDGKYVVKFADKKLVAVSKQHLRQKMDEEVYQAKLKELEDIKAAKDIEREKRKKEREEAAKNAPPKEVYVPGQKWWEKNKKE